MSTVAYHRPRRLEDAMRLRSTRAGACYVAGGTDLLVGPAASPKTLVSLRGIEELAGIDVETGRIGALTTVGDVVRHTELASAYPILVAAARRLGSEQIRNQATVGGNLCRAAPCADLAPPLLVLEAEVEIQGPDGARSVPLGEFFKGPGVTCLASDEVMTAVRLPPPRRRAIGVFLKKGRVRMDLSIASLAVLLTPEDGHMRRVRLAAGSLAPAPIRLPDVEAMLEGEEASDALLRAAGARAAQTVMPISDVRSTEAYRRHITSVFVRRGVAQAVEGEPS